MWKVYKTMIWFKHKVLKISRLTNFKKVLVETKDDPQGCGLPI